MTAAGVPRAPSAPRSAPPTAPCSCASARPRRRRLERLDEHAAAHRARRGRRRRGSGPSPRRCRASRRARPRRGGAGRPARGRGVPTASGGAVEADDRQAGRTRWPRARRYVRSARCGGRCDRQREREPRLLLVGQARDVGRRAGLLELAQGLGARGEARQGVGVEALAPRARPHAQGDLGDDAERALRAEQQLAQVRPGGARRHRRASRARPPGWRRAARRRARRCARSRSRPGRRSASPPSRRPSRTRSSAGSGRASGRARRAAARPPGPVVPAANVASCERSSSAARPLMRARSSADRREAAAAQRLDAADDARAAAERDDGDPCSRADREHAARPRRGRRGRRPRRAP